MDRHGRRRWERSRSLVSPALSITAIVIALSGVAYAADLLPINSVGQKQLRNKAVGSAELRGKAVGSRHLKAGAVGSEQLKPGSVGPEALGIPIGASGAQDQRRIGVVMTGACGPWEGPGEPPKCLPPIPKLVLSDQVELPEAGFIRISGTVAIDPDGVYGHTDGTATVELDVKLGGPDMSPNGETLSPQTKTSIKFGEQKVVPFEAFAEVPAGVHHVKLVLGGHGFDYLNVYATSAVMTTTVESVLPAS